MTEQEIIDYLKENKQEGVAFAFMPDDVKEWCRQHEDESIFFFYEKDRWEINSTIRCTYNGIYSLPYSYEPKADFKPHWEELEVDKVGWFTYRKKNRIVSCVWWHWQAFLADNSDKYNAFGGWLHTNDNDWCMIPMCYIDNQLCTYCNRDKKTTPAIPTKIRFWRFRE